MANEIFALSQSASEVQKAIDNALNPDTTLSVRGNPADAKAAGDALTQVHSVLNQANSKIATSNQSLALIYTLLEKAVYTADMSAKLAQLKTLLESGGSGGSEATLTGISVSYSGGPVPVGTLVHDLSGVAVTARYSDGSTATVTDWTFLADHGDVVTEDTNTVWVRYMDYEASFAVVGIAVDEEADVTQVGNTLIVKSGVTASQSGSALKIV